MDYQDSVNPLARARANLPLSFEAYHPVSFKKNMSAIALSTTRARQLQYPPEGLREDLLLLEVDDQLLADVAKHG